MIGNHPESASSLRVTGVGLAGAGALFLCFFGYCKASGLISDGTVPVSVSARWAASSTLCWSAVLLAFWANRHQLRAAATGSVRAQAALFAIVAAVMLAADTAAMQLGTIMANEPLSLRETLARIFVFAPRAAMLSAIAMLSLILWNRRVVSVRPAPAAPVTGQGEWLDFPEAPLLRLRAEDVRLIRSAGNYSEIVCAERTWLVRAPLSELAARLLPRGFVRVHRRAVINARHVRRIDRDRMGRPAITLSCGETVPVGRSYRDRLDALTG